MNTKLIVNIILASTLTSYATPQKATAKSGQQNKKNQQQSVKTSCISTAAPIAAPQKQTENTNIKQRTITVTNGIQDKMLNYKYGFLSYSPSSFNIKVNGAPLECSKSSTVTLDNNRLEVTYDYAFLGGKRKGSKCVTLEIPDNIDRADIAFTWHTDQHVTVNGAKFVSIKTVY